MSFSAFTRRDRKLIQDIKPYNTYFHLPVTLIKHKVDSLVSLLWIFSDVVVTGYTYVGSAAAFVGHLMPDYIC